MARAPDARHELIIVDAFSSEAIPVHLLTREAIQMYLSKLADDGLLVFHISNRYLDLEPVLARFAASEGLRCVMRSDTKVTAEDRKSGKSASKYVVLSGASSRRMDALLRHAGWEDVPIQEGALWTDQYSNILSLFRWQ